MTCASGPQTKVYTVEDGESFDGELAQAEADFLALLSPGCAPVPAAASLAEVAEARRAAVLENGAKVASERASMVIS
jgi:hypothetical protein